MRIPHPTYAGVTATLALFIALGGSSYAALNVSYDLACEALAFRLETALR